MHTKSMGGAQIGIRRVLRLAAARTAQLASGIFLVLICFSFPNWAHALNGFSFVTLCSTCQTTADFVAAARGESRNQTQSGLYQVVSGSQPRLAAMSVTGHFNNPTDPIWVVDSVIPVDSFGNSLAGQSESSQEAYYAALDQMTFGTDRSNPLAPMNMPSGSNINSFIGSSDAAVSAAIISFFPPGAIVNTPLVTVYFPDGTNAQYVQLTPGHWTWNGKAWKNGKPIDRNGNPISNPNTSGLGGGNVNAPEVGGGHDLSWEFDGSNTCVSTTVVSIGGIFIGSWSGFVPC